MLKVAQEKEGSKVGYRVQNQGRMARVTVHRTTDQQLSRQEHGGPNIGGLGTQVFAEEAIEARFHRVVCLEEGVFELRSLISASNIDSALSKAKELTGLAARAGSTEAMKICIAIQLVGRQGLLQRTIELVEELLVGVKSFKENLMFEGR